MPVSRSAWTKISQRMKRGGLPRPGWSQKPLISKLFWRSLGLWDLTKMRTVFHKLDYYQNRICIHVREWALEVLLLLYCPFKDLTLVAGDVVVLLRVCQEQQPWRERFTDLGRGRVYTQCALMHMNNGNNYIFTLVLSHFWWTTVIALRSNFFVRHVTFITIRYPFQICWVWGFFCFVSNSARWR